MKAVKVERRRLNSELKNIFEYPFSIIEAPIGYGKTTAIKDYVAFEECNAFYINFLSEKNVLPFFWKSFCEVIGKIDRAEGEKLEGLGFPDDALKLANIISILEEVEYPKKTVIILDDFHLLNEPDINLFLKTVVSSGFKDLHIVLVTRNTANIDLAEFLAKGLVYIFPQKQLAFTLPEVRKLCKLKRLHLTEEQIGEIYELTGGWVSLVYLMIMGAKHGLEIKRNSVIDNIIETALYNVYDENVKHFLLKLSIMDIFTENQARFVTEEKHTSGIIRRLARDNAFVVYDHKNDTYKIHNIMLDFLRSRFTDEEEKKALYRRLGQWFLSQNEYLQAYTNLFYGGDTETILGLFEDDSLPDFDDIGFSMADELFSGAPKELLYRYPFAYLKYIGFLLRSGDPEKASRGVELLEEVYAHFSNDDSLNPEHRDLILAEICVNRVFIVFNDFEQMVFHTAEAAKLLKGRQSKIMRREGEYTFGCPHFLYTYYMEPGTLKRTADYGAREFPLFSEIANGIGTGSDYLIRAEYALETGDYEGAELNAKKAIIKARMQNQNCISINANFVLLRLYVFQGKVEHTHEVMRRLREDVKRENNPLRNMTLEIITGYIHAILGNAYEIPKWLREGTMSDACWLLDGIYFNYIVHGKAVLLTRKFLELEMLSETLPQYFSVFKNRMGFIHSRILRAIARYHLYEKEAAISELKELMEETKSDNIILIYAEYAPQITEMVKAICLLGSESYFTEILNACLRFRESLKRFNEDVVSLSKREREILSLAGEGYTRSEIAQRLFLAPGTVKIHLHNIYSKLDAKGKTDAIRRAELLKLI
ncbi:MAG: LuxR family transcriptional regulator [Clostridiales bacterium]|nr:LuxR family transcriptional regulator [Clostridiales bacterium]